MQPQRIIQRCQVKWERHTEFKRYSIVQPLPAYWALDAVGASSVALASDAAHNADDDQGAAQHERAMPSLAAHLVVSADWLHQVPGSTIAAISYYVVSLLLYGGKALKAMGWPINPEVAAGALIPLVLWVVWWETRRIKHRVHDGF